MARRQGRAPSTEAIIAVRNKLLQTTDLRRMSNLETQLKGNVNLTDDASQSLISLLQVSHPCCSPPLSCCHVPLQRPLRSSDRCRLAQQPLAAVTGSRAAVASMRHRTWHGCLLAGHPGQGMAGLLTHDWRRQ